MSKKDLTHVGRKGLTESVDVDLTQGGGLLVELADGHKALVGLQQQAVGGGEAQGFGVVVLAEGEVEAVAQVGIGHLGLAAEAVYHPRHGGLQLALQRYQFGLCFYRMDYQRFANGLGQQGLAAEEVGLQGQGCLRQPVQSCFAHGQHLRVVQQLCKPLFPIVGLPLRVAGLPGMDACGVPVAGLRTEVGGRHADDGCTGHGGLVVGVNVELKHRFNVLL